MDYRPALRQRTGVGEYVHGLATALASRLPPDDSLTLFSSAWKDRLPPDVVPGTNQVDARVPVSVLNFLWHRLEWPDIQRLAPPMDVVHSLHPLLIPSRRAAQLVTIHDFHFLDRPDHTRAEIRRDYPALAAAHARRADGIIVNSQHTARQVVERFAIDPERITVCYPGNPGWPRQTTAPHGGAILFIGTAEPRKNLRCLIEAYESLRARRPDAPDLVVAGAGSDSLEAVLNRSPAKARIRLTGYVSDDVRQRLYREAAVLVLPSLDEGFGITALEAMTTGTPVVASNRGALPEVVGDAGILVDPEDVAAISAALERVLSDATLRQAMSDRGVIRAARFSWVTAADALLDAYRNAERRRGTR
jgi:glycosyltransferase involved in cell wall biosynthesis